MIIHECKIVFGHMTLAEFQDIIEKFARFLPRNKPELIGMDLNVLADSATVMWSEFHFPNKVTSVDAAKLQTIIRSLHNAEV